MWRRVKNGSETPLRSHKMGFLNGRIVSLNGVIGEKMMVYHHRKAIFSVLADHF